MDSIKELLSMKLPVASSFSWLSEAASETTRAVDWTFYFLIWSCIGLFLLVIVPVFWFAFHYRRKKVGPKALSQIADHKILELSWTLIPCVYLFFLFYWGFLGFVDLYTIPIEAKNLRVVGQKWNWTVQYPDEDISVSGQGAEIGVVLDQPVQLTMSSQDVIHSFFVPNFRVKQDVLPGRYTTLWFQPNKVGVYPVFCTEYCGDQHSSMLAKIKVMPQNEYDEWLAKNKNENNDLPPSELGLKLYAQKACNACHSVDGTPRIGPSFKGIYGHKTELSNGSSVLVDDNYIRESILDPQIKIVKGYPPVMPTFKGQLSETEINALIEYIKSLK
ncbi:MAG: cytochrome c oxidase subunit II [bacterium]|nr:cytochrome c oxidase subunit II [bacterium]